MGRVVEHAFFDGPAGWGVSRAAPVRRARSAPYRRSPVQPPLAAPNLPAGALSALVQGLGALVGVEGSITGTLPGSSSAAALLGAQPIPSIATTSIPAFQESALPASHVLRTCSQRPGKIPRA